MGREQCHPWHNVGFGLNWVMCKYVVLLNYMEQFLSFLPCSLNQFNDFDHVNTSVFYVTSLSASLCLSLSLSMSLFASLCLSLPLFASFHWNTNTRTRARTHTRTHIYVNSTSDE